MTLGGVALAGAVVVGLQSVIVTYDGWSGPIYFGEELRDPERDIPRSMIGGVFLVLAIYLVLNAAFVRVIPIGEMAGDPFVAASAAARVFGPRGELLLRLVVIVSLVAAVNANLLRHAAGGRGVPLRDELRPAFAGLFVSRRRVPLARRPFRVPLYPWVPGMALAAPSRS